MRTSFHHQPEAQHPNFQLSTSCQADYPIFRGKSGRAADITGTTEFDPSRSAVANNMSWKPRAPPRRVLHLAVTMSGVGQMQLVKAHAGIFLDVAAS
jgi:hypothetical protein